MKKIILVIVLILSIVLFVSACSSEDSPDESNELIESNEDINDQGEDRNEDDESQDALGERLSAAYVDMMKSQNYTVKYKTIVDMEGSEFEADITMAMSEGRTAFNMESDSVRTSTIMTEDEMKIVDHNSKTVMVMALNMDIEAIDEDTIDLQNIDAQNMEYVGSGSGEFMGTTRSYEEYKLEDTSFYYYFDGDDLVGMETISDEGSFTLHIESMTEGVDESMFEIPDDYQVMQIGA